MSQHSQPLQPCRACSEISQRPSLSDYLHSEWLTELMSYGIICSLIASYFEHRYTCAFTGTGLSPDVYQRTYPLSSDTSHTVHTKGQEEHISHDSDHIQNSETSYFLPLCPCYVKCRDILGTICNTPDFIHTYIHTHTQGYTGYILHVSSTARLTITTSEISTLFHSTWIWKTPISF